MDHRLIVFADYTCPFCYLAELQVARAGLAEHGVELDSAAFELRPAGTALPDPDAAWMREGWERSVLPLAREFGADMHFPRLQVRTRKAHEAVAYARSEGVRAAMHAAVYRAYWQDGLDIGRIDVLVGLGEGVGLDRTALKIALDIDQWSERVEEDTSLARQLRLTAVPAYLRVVPAGDGAQVRADLRVGLLRHGELKDWVTNDVRADDGGTDT